MPTVSEAESLGAFGTAVVSSAMTGDSEGPDVSMALLASERSSTVLSFDPNSAEEGGTIVISVSPDEWASIGMESDDEGTAARWSGEVPSAT